MLVIELCRVCLADSIRMYPIEHTRYKEVFEWYTEDTMDMNDELPYSVCYLCNAVLNKLYDFLKNMINTEIYLKEILRNSSKLTCESVEKLKQEMIAKPQNRLSKIWLRNSNFIALDAFKGHRPPRELQRYFENPPIMIEYHKPYEHMKLEDIPEEQELEQIEEAKEAETEELKEAETEELKEAETEELKEAETEELKEAETEEVKETKIEEIKEAKTEEIKETKIEEIKEAKTEEIKEAEIEVNMEVEMEAEMEVEIEEVISEEKKDSKTPQQNSQENENQQIPREEKFKNQPVNNKEDTVYDSETTAEQDEFPNKGGEIISVEEYITPNIPNMEIDDESNNSSEQSDHESESNLTDTPDSIDLFLLRAKKYTKPPEIVKSYKEYVTKEAVKTNIAENHNPYLEFLKERIGIEKEPQEKQVKIPGPVKFHNPYLQFIEERIETEVETHEKMPETSEQRIKSPHLHIIEHPLKETEPEQTPQQMEIDKNINTNTSKKSTDLAVEQLEERYYNLYLESIKGTPSKISNKPLIFNKSTPVSREPTQSVTTENKPVKVIVTSEPKKCLNASVAFLREKGHGSIENARKLVKESKKIPILPKNTRNCKLTKKSSQKMVSVTPAQEKSSDIKTIKGPISEHNYFNHQKKYRRASILKKTHLPHRTHHETKLLATKIKTRAAIIRQELLKFKKTGMNAEKVVEEHTVVKLARNEEGQSGISELQEENSPKHLPFKSKEHSDSLHTEITPKLPQDNKNKIDCRVKESQKNKKIKNKSPVKSKHIDRVSDELKEQNQGNQDNDQVTLKDQVDQKLKDQNDVIILEEHANNQMWSDEEDDTMDIQVDRALKVLDESLKDDIDPILRNEEDHAHDMPNDQNNHRLTDNNDPSLQLKNICITIEEDQESNNIPIDQENPPLIVHNVFTLQEQGSEDEDLIPQEQYDHIMMLANQDDQIMEDGQVAVKIESIDEDFQGSFEEEHEEENVRFYAETFYNEDAMDPDNYSDALLEQDDIKKEVEQNMQIDEEVSEYEPYLQQRVSPHESTSQRVKQDGPSNYNNPDFKSNYNDIQGLNTQEHYNIRSISQITAMATVQLERLPMDLIKNIKKKKRRRVKYEKYSCEFCDFKTKTKKILIRHQHQHEVYKKYVCDICQHRFLSPYHLSRHKVIHADHNNMLFYCSFCDFKTINKFTMDNHENIHRNVKLYPCLTGCHKRFRTIHLRSAHICKKHSFKCEVCSKTFKYDASYKRHLALHGGAQTGYKCSICNKGFHTEKKCSNHYKMHIRKEKLYACTWCNKMFNSTSNRNKHIKLHMKYKKIDQEANETETEAIFKQDIVYDTDNEVELHETERRDDEKFVCSLCPKLFDTETELGQHAVDHIL